MAPSKAKYITAQDEVNYANSYRALLVAAGCRSTDESGHQTRVFRVPFCNHNCVSVEPYSKMTNGSNSWIMIYIPRAHNAYEKRYLNAIDRRNRQEMESHGVTLDKDANEVMRMCL